MKAILKLFLLTLLVGCATSPAARSPASSEPADLPSIEEANFRAFRLTHKITLDLAAYTTAKDLSDAIYGVTKRSYVTGSCILKVSLAPISPAAKNEKGAEMAFYLLSVKAGYWNDCENVKGLSEARREVIRAVRALPGLTSMSNPVEMAISPADPFDLIRQ